MRSEKSYFPEDVQQRYRALRSLYGERESDIYISSYSRSGTTWTQLLLYQLTTSGAMDFEHLFDVSPWLYYSALRNELPAQPPEPRILKTHDAYDFFAPATKGRFIFVYRDGKDVLVSFYHHKINVKGYTGSFAQHFKEFIHNEDYNWFYHLRDWAENKNNLPILYIRYESLKQDFDNTVQRIVEFCDLKIDTSILQRSKERTQFAFMKQHASQLGPKPEHVYCSKTGGYTVKDPSAFIRKGSIGEGEQILTPEQKQIYHAKLDEVLGHLEPFAHLRAQPEASIC